MQSFRYYKDNFTCTIEKEKENNRPLESSDDNESNVTKHE
jgi:hypothetical protein